MSYPSQHRVTVRNSVFIYRLKSKVFQILTYIRQERPNERYRNTVKDLLLPNTVNQKDEKQHTAGLDDTAIPHIKIKITEIPLEKKAQYRKLPCPPLWCFSILWHYLVFFFCLGSKLGFLPKELMNKQASMTGGLVGQSEHLFLPSVPPLVTMILTLLSLMVRNLLLTSKIIILQDYGVRGRGHSKFHTGRLPPKSPNL